MNYTTLMTLFLQLINKLILLIIGIIDWHHWDCGTYIITTYQVGIEGSIPVIFIHNSSIVANNVKLTPEGKNCRECL